MNADVAFGNYLNDKMLEITSRENGRTGGVCKTIGGYVAMIGDVIETRGRGFDKSITVTIKASLSQTSFI